MGGKILGRGIPAGSEEVPTKTSPRVNGERTSMSLEKRRRTGKRLTGGGAQIERGKSPELPIAPATLLGKKIRGNVRNSPWGGGRRNQWVGQVTLLDALRRETAQLASTAWPAPQGPRCLATEGDPP